MSQMLVGWTGTTSVVRRIRKQTRFANKRIKQLATHFQRCLLCILQQENNKMHCDWLTLLSPTQSVRATRATFHSSLNAAPGGLTFGRAMAPDTPLIADLQLIQKQRQHPIDDRLIAANRHRFSYNCNVGDQVLKLKRKPGTLEPRAAGPFCVERVHANGALTIRVAPHVIKRILLHRVKPCLRWRVFVPQAKVSPPWIASRQHSVILHSATLRGRMTCCVLVPSQPVDGQLCS
jgi:hypothetical protein